MDDQPNGSSITGLPDDGDTPFSPPTPPSKQDDTHPATDAELQPEEVYEEGLTGAAEIEEPNAGNAVVGYDPMTQRHDDPEKNDTTETDDPTENGDPA